MLGKKQFLQQVVLGKLASYMQNNEVRTHPHTTDKNKLTVGGIMKRLPQEYSPVVGVH